MSASNYSRCEHRKGGFPNGGEDAPKENLKHKISQSPSENTSGIINMPVQTKRKSKRLSDNMKAHHESNQERRKSLRLAQNSCPLPSGSPLPTTIQSQGNLQSRKPQSNHKSSVKSSTHLSPETPAMCVQRKKRNPSCSQEIRIKENSQEAIKTTMKTKISDQVTEVEDIKLCTNKETAALPIIHTDKKTTPPPIIQDTDPPPVSQVELSCSSKVFDLTKLVSTAIKFCQFSDLVILKEKYENKFKELIDDDDETGTEWLCEAVLAGHLDIVQFLLKSGAAPDFVDHKDQPLILSTSADICELLLQHGANVDGYYDEEYFYFKENCPQSAMEKAIMSNRIDIVNVLIKHGANVGKSLTFLAIQLPKSQKNVQDAMYKYMREYNFDPNKCDTKNAFYRAIYNKNFNFIEILAKKGLERHYLSQELRCAAIQGNDPIMAQFLIDLGADVNEREKKYDETSLDRAVTYDRDGSIIRLLIENGANVESRNELGKTAFHLAAEENEYTAFCALVDYCPNVNFRHKGKTLLSYLLGGTVSGRGSVKGRYDYLKYIKYLLTHGGKVTSKKFMFAIHRSIAFDEFELLFILIRHGGFSPIVLNARTLFYKVDERLIWKFENVFSPLCTALLYGHVKLAEDMVKALYLTTSDLILLPKNKSVRNHLLAEGSYESLKFLDDMRSKPPSLMQMSFAYVSDLVGPQPGREERVKQLGLPLSFKKSLMFSVDNQVVGIDK